MVKLCNMLGETLDIANGILALHCNPFRLQNGSYIANMEGERICPHCCQRVGMDGICNEPACAVNNCTEAALVEYAAIMDHGRTR